MADQQETLTYPTSGELPYLTSGEFAKRVGVSAGTVSKQLRDGVIPYVTTEGGGGKWIPVGYVAKYLRDHRAEGRSVAMRERRRREIQGAGFK